MQIHLLRHGIAEAATAGMSDAGRALVPDGKRELRSVLGLAKSIGVAPSLILTSPYLRALETAEIAAELLGYEGDLAKTDALRPGCSPGDAWGEIRNFAAEPNVFVVGHNPLLSYLGTFLVGASSVVMDFEPGSLAGIDMRRMGAEPRGVLRWYYTSQIASLASKG